MISVVIPLYNKEKAIVATLNSVKAQTFSDYECIIVDDGSTDNSRAVVEKWLLENSPSTVHFTLYTKPNGGVSSARNRGVEEAKGDYVAFLDGDDLWEPTYLEELAKLINDYPNAGIYGLGYGRIINGKTTESTCRLPKDFRGVVSDVWEKNLMLYWTSSSSSSSSRARMVPFDEHLTHGEDLDVWLRLMLQGDAVFYNKTLAYYVQDAENRAMNRVPAIDKHIVSVIERYKEVREANPAFRKAFDTQMIGYLFPYLLDKRYHDEALRLANMLDYSQLKRSLRFRVDHPYLYNIYQKLRGR